MYILFPKVERLSNKLLLSEFFSRYTSRGIMTFKRDHTSSINKQISTQPVIRKTFVL